MSESLTVGRAVSLPAVDGTDGARAEATAQATALALPLDGRRKLQLALGGLWLLDGILQFQPSMFTKARREPAGGRLHGHRARPLAPGQNDQNDQNGPRSDHPRPRAGRVPVAGPGVLRRRRDVVRLPVHPHPPRPGSRPAALPPPPAALIECLAMVLMLALPAAAATAAAGMGAALTSAAASFSPLTLLLAVFMVGWSRGCNH